MEGAASRPGTRSRAVIWNGRTLLKPTVKKHARLVEEFYLFEQRWCGTEWVGQRLIVDEFIIDRKRNKKKYEI